MTEKDLLDSLRFVDDDLIEEAGLEQLKEEKQKKINGKTGLQKVGIPKTRGGAPASRAACMRGHTPLIIMVYNIKQKSRLPAVR